MIPLDRTGSGGPALARLRAKLAESAEASAFISRLDGSAEMRNLLKGAFAGSPYLLSLAERHRKLMQDIMLTDPVRGFAASVSNTAQRASNARTVAQIMAALRQGKIEIALLLALADLGGAWDVPGVTARLSEAADVFVRAAVDYLLRTAAARGTYLPRDDDLPGKGSGLIVLAMGKLGAGELNYSSDIDLIVFYDPEVGTFAPGTEARTFFVRLARDLVHILQEQTADGYVFRTDLRLRPDPGSTQAAVSTQSAFAYYESLGQNWERAAFIKARPIAGDLEAGAAFLKALEPYIWRKYLDFNAIADIHAMKRQIHAEKGHAAIAVAGHNLKLGRGGIREIEFFVQSQQLIAGGRQPRLRVPQTLNALDRLAELEWIDDKARNELTDAYLFLRRMEHRLQMVADRQTHTLPRDEADLTAFAAFAGYEHLADFETELRDHLEHVQAHYAALFETTPELTPSRVSGNLVFTGDADDPATLETLGRLGFKAPASAIALIKGWHFGRYRAMRSVRVREILTEFTPALLDALSQTSQPDAALATFDAFLKELPAALELFSTLRANPELLRLLARIMGSAPRLARILSRRHRLLDAILDPGYLGHRPSETELRTLVRGGVMDAAGYEARLDRARVVGQEQAFLVGAALLSGSLPPREAGAAYSLLAEALVDTLADAVQQEFGAGFPPPAILAMGKLGGREMTAASDLDLIVVYDPTQESAASAPQHYARWTQRLIAALSAPTAEGVLYPVDMRLRPSGKAGPLAVSLGGFIAYQRNEAWTWEHLALTRARAVAGCPFLRARLTVEMASILALPRNAAKTASDVRDMRDRIAREKAPEGFWDIRAMRGGLVDVEFIAQYLQIVHAAANSAILNTNTLSAIASLERTEFLTPAHAAALSTARALYEDMMQLLRLCAEGAFLPGEAPRDLIDLVLQVARAPDIDRLEHRLKTMYAEVDALFGDLVR